MEIKDFLDDLNIVAKLGTFPNADDGLAPEELKEKFDESGKMVQKYINEHIVPAIRTLISMSGGRMEFRFVENTVQWRYLPQGGAPESEWQALFTTDNIREKVAQDVLAEAKGYAEAAEQSAQQAKEAAAAVPTKLPNPHAFVINGQSYDGSERVEVEVEGKKEVHTGPEPPTNGEAIWINPDEEPESGGGVVDPEAIKQAVDAYMAENPVKETDPTVPEWAKQPNKPKYTAAEVGALPADAPIPEGVTDEQVKNAVDAYLTENPPRGGGGGGLPIVFNTEITEAVATFVANKDNNGNPFSLSNFELNISIPVVKGVYQNGAIYINDGLPASCVTYYHDDTSVKHCVCIRGDLVGGTIVFEKMGQNFAKGIDFGLLTKPITSINIKTFSETLRVPVGTKICLRGV